MEAIVLAGGLGTRLQSVVSDVPKPMALVDGKPFLEYILKYLKKNGANRVVLSVGYKWEIIQDYFGDSFEGTEILYSVENEPLGTGGAIKKALHLVKSDEVFIINGDTFFDIDLKKLELKNKSKLMLSLKKMKNFDRYGSVSVSGDRKVTEFREKEFTKEGNINGGIYLISRDIFDDFELEEKFSFEEFMQNNLDKLNISAKIFDSYFIDIGIPKDYKKVQSEIKNYL